MSQSNMQVSNIFRYDWMQVHDGSDSDAPLIGEKLCGNFIPDLIFPSENELFLEFRSDHADSFSGFKIKVQESGRKILFPLEI